MARAAVWPGGISACYVYESLEDKFHAPTAASSGEFHGSSSRYLDREANVVCLLNKELSFISRRAGERANERARVYTARTTTYHVANAHASRVLIAVRTCARAV